MYVELKSIYKYFGDFKASDDVSFSIEKGKLVGLLGPSGSGKTTILRMIAGLEAPDSGDIFVDGKRINGIPAAKRGIGFVFQNYALFRYMNVFDNIAFGLEIQKRDKKYIRSRVGEMISLIGLTGLEKRFPYQLSGGQKQRVAFARALAPNPQLLMLDEPFAAIDAKVRKELRSWLRETIAKVGITSIFVTHDQDEAIEVADEIIITNLGKVIQSGSPAEIYQNPRAPFVARFIGESAEIENYSVFKGFFPVDGFERAFIRPEFVGLFELGTAQYANSAEEGIVEDVFFRGGEMELRVNVKGIRVISRRSPAELEMQVGEKVSVIVYRLYLFNDSEVKLVENEGLIDREPVFI
ncbi:MAG: ABC transporter ATP-binding protein [Clostridiales bacterium]|jgi:sulfate transport system ATP-binding protein|nr:ABC transporter ATP-binding protein [Clostridiales bacterium]